MKSIDTLLAEAIGKMSPATLGKYNERVAGKRLPQENLVNIAESLVAQEGQRSPIRRNNGAQGLIDEGFSPEKADAMLIEGLIKARPQQNAGLIKETATADQLTESQRKDYEFAKMVGMSEEDALKSAKL
jgi:hypothetical protein